MADLQNLLRGHENDPVSNDIHRLKEAAKRDFQAEDEEAKDCNWLHMQTDDEKKNSDPERFLKEKFKQGKQSKKMFSSEQTALYGSTISRGNLGLNA